MEKVYQQLRCLDMDQALDYLGCLTGSSVTERALLRFGEERQLGIHVDIYPPGVDGKIIGSGIGEKITFGLYQILNPAMVFSPSGHKFPALIRYGESLWTGLLPPWSSGALFKSEDIEALADKMNRTAKQPNDTEESEALRQQLEQERAARKTAEQRAEQAEAEAKPKLAHLLAIAGLLELLLDDNRPRYNTQGSAAEAIEALHPDWRGASSSNLDKLFADANKAAKEADKIAQAKAESREASARRATARKTAKT